jgi:hypothetical protein
MTRLTRTNEGFAHTTSDVIVPMDAVISEVAT